MQKTLDTQVIERWKAFRIRHIDKNQAEAAKKLGTTAAGLSYIENGKRAINYKVVSAAITKFDLNPEWLSSGKGAEKKKKEPTTLVTDIAELRQQIEIQLNMIKVMGVQLNHLYKEFEKIKKS
ncbi:helix-turn-helix domain-containing protein [Pedobacter sp.]